MENLKNIYEELGKIEKDLKELRERKRQLLLRKEAIITGLIINKGE